MSNVTMRDIADAVGVSTVTVSKALSGSSGVGPEMREKIIRLAGEMGYTNPNAKRRQNLRPLDIGVLVPMRHFKPQSYYGMIYPLVVQELTNAGHFCLFETLDEAAENACEIPNLIRARHVDGLILLGEPHPEYLRALTEQPTPIVYMDFFDDRASAPAVVGDNAYGAFRLTSHLIKNGHREIGFVGTIEQTTSIMDRYLGFYRAMLTNHLPIREEWIIKDRDARGKVALEKLPAELPTAFVCNCDLVAHKVMAQLMDMGLRVPEDVSVVGFDDFPATPAGLPEVSTFRIDYERMVQATVKLMIDRCTGEAGTPNRMVIGGRPFYKASDGPAPGK